MSEKLDLDILRLLENNTKLIQKIAEREKLKPSVPRNVYQDFMESMKSSSSFGKINKDKKCPICGESISDSEMYLFQARVGRLLFLLRLSSHGSSTASDFIRQYIHTLEKRGARDIPTGDPQWWNDLVMKIDSEAPD